MALVSGILLVPTVSAESDSPVPGLRPDFLERADNKAGYGTGDRSEASVLDAHPTDHYQLEGVASWYGGKFQGRLTANGEVFDTNELTAAHRELPFNTIVRVTNTTNERSVVVRINDRGPFVDNRVIDLSRAAADIIELTGAGIAPVKLEILHYEPESDLRTLQVGSFSSEANARAVADRLHAAGFSPEIETVSGASVFRVVLVDIREVNVGDQKARLAGIGFTNVLVRRQ